MTNIDLHRYWFFAIACHYYYEHVKLPFVIVLVSRRLSIEFLHCLLYNSIITGAISAFGPIGTFDIMNSTFTDNNAVGGGGMCNCHL